MVVERLHFIEGPGQIQKKTAILKMLFQKDWETSV